MSAMISQELALQSRVHQCGVTKHSAFSGLTTVEQRKESFRLVILENKLEEKLGEEFERIYGEKL